jgi:predicted MFS family arabinose efflux permease
MRVVLDRRRGGAYLAIALAGIGMFAVFLFLTYYLQQTLGFSPLMTGVAFLPLVGGLVICSAVLVPRLLPRVGPRPLVVTGQLLAAAGLLILWRLQVGSSYTGHVLPALIVMGLGLGLIFGSCFNTATSGIRQSDAGVASALVNTGQQVGGALGTALLNTIAATAASSYLSSRQPSPAAVNAAAVAGDTRAFLIAAGIFLVAAVASVLVLPNGPNPVQ